jgi:hypothetical protein
MSRRLAVYSFVAVCLGLLAVPATAAPISALCNSGFTFCAIPENVLLQLPFFGIAGDVILLDPGTSVVSDVFRIQNNFVNTGLGTGLGNLAFLFSADDSTPLPDPSTYSANKVFMTENQVGGTLYTNNGTTYLLGAPEPGTLQLGILAAAAMLLLSRRRMRRMLAGIAALCGSAFCQQTVNLTDGPVNVIANFDLPPGRGPAQDLSSGSAAGTGLAFYTANYSALGGFQLPFNIVGTDPSLGANTTVIPTVLVPLKFVFANTGNPTLDGTNVVAPTQNSPIFLSADYTAGVVDLGVTQYGDALQRAEFWNLPGFSTGYHVLLGSPSVAATITITVPAAQGNAYALSGGGFLGVLDDTYFESLLTTLLPTYSANQLPIFLTDNVYLGTGGLIQNCCTLGFHSSQGAPIGTAKTWIYAAYAEPGTFGSPGSGSFEDVVPLSHEVAEWLNDPFVGAFPGLNFIPPAVLPGQGGSCIINFETGDPLEALSPFTFSKTTNGKVYHLQDEVTLPWYLHTTPSFSANGWYSFQNVNGVLPLVINSPPSIAGSYTNTARLAFAPVATAVSADVVYVGRGCPANSISPGSPADPYLANPSGKIVLIDRGACAVSLKIDAAANAGAIGVLIGLVAPGNAVSFAYGGGSNFVPSLVITQDTSNLIKGALGSSTVNGTLSPNNAIPIGFSALCGPG